MIVEVQLGEADRARYGCPEWMPVDINSMSVREAIVLQRGVDVGEGLVVQFETPAAWRQALGGRDEDGYRRGDWGAELVLVWLALKRNGVEVRLSEVEYDAGQRDYRMPGDAQAGPGKDESTPPTTSNDDSGGTSPS